MINWFTPSKSDMMSGEQYNALYNTGSIPGDRLIGLREQLKGLAGQIPGQVATQKANTAARVATAKTEGMQNINENIRAERGFGNTSLQDRLNNELLAKLVNYQNESDLASDQWGVTTTADILNDTESMYPDEPTEEQPSWQSGIMGSLSKMGGNWLTSGNNAQDAWGWISNLLKSGNQNQDQNLYSSISDKYYPNQRTGLSSGNATSTITYV